METLDDIARKEFYRVCKHDIDFVFIACTAADRLPGIWVCGYGCGFSLPFDPKEFPHGLAYIHSPKEQKVQATLDSSKY